jgi:hypothetical protein
MGELDKASSQLDHIVSNLRFGHGREDDEQPTPIASALLARIALDAGQPVRAKEICQYELRPQDDTSRDLSIPAESWKWSVHVLGRVWDETVDLRRRLQAARPLPSHGPGIIRLTRREMAEMGLAACRRAITDPMLGGVALIVARNLTASIDYGEAFLQTINRSAPMWHMVALQR